MNKINKANSKGFKNLYKIEENKAKHFKKLLNKLNKPLFSFKEQFKDSIA